MRPALAANSFLALLLALLAFGLGCATPAPFGQVDLSLPGWKTRNGQALWRPGRDKPEIVGDLVVARHEDGRAYLQFSKALPIVSARVSAQGWEAEFPPQNKRYAARGKPPRRIVWLQLLNALRGEPVSPNWSVNSTGPDQLILEDSNTGERLDVHF
jgi:hypothetical protein